MHETDARDRQREARELREKAAWIAECRVHPEHRNNGEEEAYRDAHSFMSFTKGLPHDPATGLVIDPDDPVKFRNAIDNGTVSEFDTNVPLGDRDPMGNLQWLFHTGANIRRWEAPTAGFVYDLEGPDAQAVTMPPAPALATPDAFGKTPPADAGNVEANPELVAEMAEVYWLALLRDTPFSAFDDRANGAGSLVDDAVTHLGNLDFYRIARGNHPRRRLPSYDSNLSRQNVFRGHTPGDREGPYLSQFLLMGDGHLGETSTLKAEDGILQYGSISIDMRVRTAKLGRDYMTHWNEWLDVQNGAHVIGKQEYEANTNADRKASFRFIATPRDLATYVHFDALYEAYLNACIWLLNAGAPVDPNFRSTLNGTDHTQGFALWGGPHILSLMTEVATRGLKAVRFQKFNNHLRLRPEALAGLIAAQTQGAFTGIADERVGKLCAALADDGFLARVAAHNAKQNEKHCPKGYLASQPSLGAAKDLPLLPMAFPEGSPMHPAYGAGHATVAGACVTMLKAFFDESARLVRRDGAVKAMLPADVKPTTDDKVAFVPTDDGSKIINKGGEFDDYLHVGGELDKLAANISIGRNMAGVHYYSDYIDSLRMGEEIAIGVLQEQSILYPKDPFRLSLTSFDGENLLIENGQVRHQGSDEQSNALVA